MLASGGDGSADRGKPVVAIGFAAAGDGEKFFLQFASDRAGRAFADLDVIDGANRGDFNGSAREENLIGDIKHFARDDGFFHSDSQILRDFHDGVARDARENAGSQRRSIEDTVMPREMLYVADEVFFAG